MSLLLLNRRRVRSGGGGGAPVGPFVPTDISGLVAWHDASDTATITNVSGFATQITDKTANGNTYTGGGVGARPSTGVNTVNGLNALGFPATGAVVMTGPSGMYSIPNGPNTVFIVMQSANAGDADQNLFDGKNAGSGSRWSMYFDSANLYAQNRTTSALYTSVALARSTTTRIIGYRRSGTAITPFYDGTQGTPGSNAENFTCSSLIIGCRTAGSFRFNGSYCEDLFYNSSLSDADMDRVGNYLADKWGASWSDINFP